MAQNSQRLILVTGATGKQGGAVLRHLRQRGFPVRAFTRDPNKPNARALVGQGVEVVRGDLDDLDSLRGALDGVHGVFSVQAFWEVGMDGEVRQGKALIDAAVRQQISHFVYSSVGGGHLHTGVPHFDSKGQVEDHLRGSGLAHTILRPAFFMDNWLSMKDMLKGGTLAQPLEPGRTLQQIDSDDIGAFAAMAFENPGRWHNRAEDISGDELSMTDLAAAFSRALGREVRYVQVPWDEFERQMGPEYASMYRWFQEHGYIADIESLRQEYPNLRPFEAWAAHQDWS